ncbi:MAG: PBP1A family penicillin-binding protein [Candidatus Krumholzibacteria bacterium]
MRAFLKKIPLSTPVIIILVVVVFVLGGVLGTYHYFARDLPSTERLESFEPSVKTRVLADDDTLIGELYEQNRVLIALDQIPQHLRDAIIAVEDRKFYSHWGVDMFGIARALMKNILAGRVVQGASTITQQLARNLFVMFDVSLSRKIKELILALKIERAYSKDEILEMYLNQIYFGSGAYGVEAAAQEFFEKRTADLTIEESTLLTGLPKNPRDYSPHYHLDRAMARRATVLRSMVDTHKITQEEADSVNAHPVVVATKRSKGPYGAYFLEYVRRYLEGKYGADRIYHDGLTVYTTLDPYLQRVAEDSMETHLKRLETSHNYEQTLASFEEMLEEGNAGRPQYLQSAVVALEPTTGYIKVMVGGRNFRHSSFNRAVQAKRQPGSAFKPFIYLTALENGYTPADIVLDAPIVLDLPNGDVWKPHNFSQRFAGEVTLRYALNKSINVAAVRILLSLGPVSAISNAYKLGIKSRLHNVYSLALGTSEVDLLEMTSAYGTLAAMGVRAEPLAVKQIVDRDGRILEENSVFREEVLSPQSSYIITNMLESVVNEGTGRGARLMGFREAVAGKTGTTDDYTDGWFIGYTPEIAVGVWTGFDPKDSMGRNMTGARVSLPTWTQVMLAHYRDHRGDPFVVPEGIVYRVVCQESGALSAQQCTRVRREVFIEGTEPTRHCDKDGVSFGPGGDGNFRSADQDLWGDQH